MAVAVAVVTVVTVAGLLSVDPRRQSFSSSQRREEREAADRASKKEGEAV